MSWGMRNQQSRDRTSCGAQGTLTSRMSTGGCMKHGHVLIHAILQYLL